MNWLERYTYAVKAYLPASTRKDVADELLTDLQDERDHRAERLGRELTDDEVKALLKERGHPLLVAANFLPRTSLVNEELFPVYTLLLRWMIVAIALAQVVLGGAALINSEETDLWSVIPQLLWGTFQACLYGFAWLTLIFYLFGESINATDFFKHWKPESLPSVSAQGEYISRTGSAIEVIVTAYFMAWLNHIIPQSLGDNPIELAFSEQWSSVLPWINAVLLASILCSVAKLLFPYWTFRKLAADLLLYLPTFAILAVIFSWDDPLIIHIGMGEGAKQFTLSDNWIAVLIIGYMIAALVDIVAKVKQLRVTAAG